MNNKFRKLWKHRIGKTDAQVQEELEGAEHYHDIGDRYHEMAEDEERHAEILGDIAAGKARVEKPGAATHTAKWDRCVAHVKEGGGGADPYAVCTAMLGSESFKTAKSMSDVEFDEKMKMYMQKLGIAGAGPVPNSLLARQDLAGEERTEKAFKIEKDRVSELIPGRKAAKSFKDYWKIAKRSRDYEDAKFWAVGQVAHGVDGFRLIMAVMREFNVNNQEAEEIAYYAEEISGHEERFATKGMTQEEFVVDHYRGFSITQLNIMGDFPNEWLPQNEFYIHSPSLARPIAFMAAPSIAEARAWIDSYLAQKSINNGKQRVATYHGDDFAVQYRNEMGSQKFSMFKNAIDAESYAQVIDELGYKSIKILKKCTETETEKSIDVVRIDGKYYVTYDGEIEGKPLLGKGAIEQTGKQLERLADKAEDCIETTERKSLVENIKAVQVKRQKATIAARSKETTKTFGDEWARLQKRVE